MSYGASWGVWWGLSLERPAWASLSPDLIRDQERDGLLPVGSAAQLGGVIVSKRGRRTLRPELVVTSGPQRLAQPGGGTVAELYGARWALGLYRGGPRLYQARSGVWHDRTDPEALADLDGARHVALAFDQAARPVVAWERSGAVYVRQWSGLVGQYVTRGPWAGCDPVLISDAPLLGETGASDVLLYHLDNDRVVVLLRVQRDVYDVPRAALALTPGALLDQVAAARAGGLVLFGELPGGAQWSAGVLYPLRAGERLTLTVGASGLLEDTARADVGAVALALTVGASGVLEDTAQLYGDGAALSLMVGASGVLEDGLSWQTAERLTLTVGASGVLVTVAVLATDANALTLSGSVAGGLEE
ncbi:hypothetical protein [Deinococcus sp. RIT780]|uniref:hypothetical protein n=1 Tax=Deinococcus sp. RIT780 TaxID=2870472 RepID=UPI001C89BE6B|nr:hypothetical protein [Deinococcus sp. RIT780]MBX8464230.1 hypothetical protein [Deinococcus sp. RIT780]